MSGKEATKRWRDRGGLTNRIFTRELELFRAGPNPKSLPTQIQLAELAATLWTSTESESRDFLESSRKALELWDAAGLALDEADPTRREIAQLQSDLAKRFEGIEVPEKIVTRDKALALLMPKKKSGERYNLIRRYLEEMISADKLWGLFGLYSPSDEDKATDSLVEIAMATLREEGFTPAYFVSFGEEFLNWLDSYSSQIRKAASKVAVNQRLKAKKSFTPKSEAKSGNRSLKGAKSSKETGKSF